MSAGQYTMRLEQGTTVSLPFRYGTNGAQGFIPYDVTGWTAKCQIRPSAASATILYEFSTAIGNLPISGPSGTFTLSASSVVTAGWAWTQGVYDLEVSPPGGATFRLVQGAVSVDAEVTR